MTNIQNILVILKRKLRVINDKLFQSSHDDLLKKIKNMCQPCDPLHIARPILKKIKPNV